MGILHPPSCGGARAARVVAEEVCLLGIGSRGTLRECNALMTVCMLGDTGVCMLGDAGVCMFGETNDCACLLGNTENNSLMTVSAC